MFSLLSHRNHTHSTTSKPTDNHNSQQLTDLHRCTNPIGTTTHNLTTIHTDHHA